MGPPNGLHLLAWAVALALAKCKAFDIIDFFEVCMGSATRMHPPDEREVRWVQ